MAGLAIGQVFTPERLAVRLAELLGLDEPGWPDPLVLDPACGDGRLLLAVCERRLALGWDPQDILAAIEGWDRDPTALDAARATLTAWGQSNGVRRPQIRLWCGDALGTTGRPGELLGRRGDFQNGLGGVIANPPYLEAKRMTAADPAMRARLRAAFPELGGAVDLYAAFVSRILDWMGPQSRAALLIPGKFCEARYTASLRERILRPPFHVAALVDLVRIRAFPDAATYPILLRVDHGGSAPTRVAQALADADLDDLRFADFDADDWRAIGPDGPLFAPFPTWAALRGLLRLPRLGEVARFASACSFHHKGLRQRFVTPDRPATDAHPYLGGPSFARAAELAVFQNRWQGWWIRYASDELKALKNPLPPLSNFLRPKVVVAQHANRIKPWADLVGTWVTKDTYPIGWPTDPRWSVEKLAALLASTVFGALHATFYQGVLVGGETYHVLPAFLHKVPIPADPATLDAVDPLVRQIQDSFDPDLWDRIDRIVTAAYGLTEPQRQQMIAVHFDRIRADRPGRLLPAT